MALPTTPPVTPAVPETPQTPEPTQPPTGQVPEQPQAEPKYVTKEQLDGAIAEATRNIKMADKQRAKQIKADMDRIVKTLEGSGITVTPEQKDKIQTQVAANYSDPEGEPAQTQQVNLDDYPPVVLAALEMMDEAGVIVQEGDPEFKELIQPLLANPGPALLRATAKAIEKKQARTLQQTQSAPLRTPTGGGQGPGQFVAEKARDYLDRAHQ